MSDIAAQFDADMQTLGTGKASEPVQKVEKSAPEAQGVAKPEDSATFDINTLPPAAKQLLEAERKKAAEIEDRYREADRDRRSLRGKIPHLEKKVAQWENEKSRAAATSRADNPTAAATSIEKREPPVSLLKGLPEWEIHRTQYPADAAPVESAFQALERKHQEELAKVHEQFQAQQAELAKVREYMDKNVKPSLDYLGQSRSAQFIQEQKAAQSVFAAKYQDWPTHAEVKQDPDTNEYVLTVSNEMGDWLDSLPKFMSKAMVQVLNSRDPADAEEVQAVFERFYDHMSTQKKTAEQAAQAHQATQVHQTRQENLVKRAVPGSSGVGVARANPENLDVATAFDMDMQRLRTQR